MHRYFKDPRAVRYLLPQSLPLPGTDADADAVVVAALFSFFIHIAVFIYTRTHFHQFHFSFILFYPFHLATIQLYSAECQNLAFILYIYFMWARTRDITIYEAMRKNEEEAKVQYYGRIPNE